MSIQPVEGTISIPGQATVATSFWDQLTQNAPRLDSGELVAHEDLARLVKVPFAIRSLDFRVGDITPKGEDEPLVYVSTSATIADEKLLMKLHRMGRLKYDDEFPFLPEETIIFNDGSTGIKRQEAEYLHTMKYISIVPDGVEIKSGGARGESTFDIPPAGWAEIHQGELRFDDNGRASYHVTLGQPLVCLRGLRPSEYQNDYTKEGVTWYLA